MQLLLRREDHPVARHPLAPLAHQSERFAAAGVLLPGGRRVVVASIHLTCCGYIGNREDRRRAADVEALVSLIRQLRTAGLGADAEPFRDAPLILMGDYNLVGSRTPLDTLAGTKDERLVTWPLRHLIGNALVTWRNDGSSFPPGRLDLLTHSDQLTRRNGYILDTAAFSAVELKRWGVEAGDSAASDHLLLVADFAFPVSK